MHIFLLHETLDAQNKQRQEKRPLMLKDRCPMCTNLCPCVIFVLKYSHWPHAPVYWRTDARERHIQPDVTVDKSILDCAVASGFPRPPGTANASG